jgi:hypothetical protein
MPDLSPDDGGQALGRFIKDQELRCVPAVKVPEKGPTKLRASTQFRRSFSQMAKTPSGGSNPLSPATESGGGLGSGPPPRIQRQGCKVLTPQSLCDCCATLEIEI